jgi:hypothetical protein
MGPLAAARLNALHGFDLDLAARSGHPLRLAPDQVVVLVAVPPDGEAKREGTRLLVNGVVVDHGLAVLE